MSRITGKRRRHKRRVTRQRFEADVNRRQLIHTGIFQFLTHIRRRGKLALGQTVNAVVLDDVHRRNIAANHVLELAQPDAAGIAITADANRNQLVVGGGSPGRNRGHTPVQRVEAVRAIQEIGR